MTRFLFEQLRHRRGRVTTLGVGIVVAAVSFVLLLSTVATGALKVKRTLARNYRPAYDILVRPTASYTALERRRQLVPDNYLSGIFGGITMKQYRAIKDITGVEVAAPIANLGYVMPAWNVNIPISGLSDRRGYQLYRITNSYSANHGLEQYPSSTTAYVYYTPKYRFSRPNGLIQHGPQGTYALCDGMQYTAPPPTGPFSPVSYLQCFSKRSHRASLKGNFLHQPVPSRSFVGVQEQAFYPLLIAGIDPIQEAKLVNLNHAMVAGRYLRTSEKSRVKRSSYPELPVIASSQSFVSDRLHIAIKRLEVQPGVKVPRALESGACNKNIIPCPPGDTIPPPKGAAYSGAYDFLKRLHGTVLKERTYSLGKIYRRFTAPGGPRLLSHVYWRSSGVSYASEGDSRFVPHTVMNTPTSTWRDPFAGYFRAPRDNQDVQFRRLEPETTTSQAFATPSLKVVGLFNPNRLPGFDPLSKVPLETYYPPRVEPADAASRKALRGHALLPTQNLAGYISQPPLLLTTLPALRPFLDRGRFPTVTAHERNAPISVVRVRVAGVRGIDQLSRERIRSVATAIHERTGLPVDITSGSSPAPMLIHLPKGRFGSPPLLVREGWTKKGVAVQYLRSINAKSLVLFILVLVVCALFLINASLAAVRTRRAEIGTLMTMGWSRAQVFRAVLLELCAVGLVAGIAGMLIALVLIASFHLGTQPYRALLIVPLATALAALSGVMPARRAAGGSPLDAIAPPVVQLKSEGKMSPSLLSMAARNVTRLPARAALGGAGLVIGVAALTVLLALERAFQTTVAGTLLGNAISIEVRGVDALSVLMVIALGALSLADVLFLNILERRAELVTLRTVGWRDGDVARLVALEGIGIGGFGSLLGAALGVVAASFVRGVAISDLALGATLAAAVGSLAAGIASLIPVARVSALTPPTVLAEE